jgi:xylan 1,4-beta-xylosidase
MITNFSSIKHYLDHSILKGGMKPIFGLEPVPEAIALENNSHYKPKDMKLWEEFNYRFITFLVDTYGKDEVLTWIFETGNEPSTEDCFWGRPNYTGDTVLDDFIETQDYTIAGCTRALPDIFIAGPSGPPETFFVPMLEHCATGTNYATGKIGTKIDAISYHGYLGGTDKDLSWRQAENQILRMQGYTDRYYALTGKRLQLFNTEFTPIYSDYTGMYDFNMHPNEDNIQAIATMHVANFSHKLGVDMLAFFYYAPFYTAPLRGDYPDMSVAMNPDIVRSQKNCPEFFGKETPISFHGIFKPVSRSFEMLSWLNGMTEISAESKTEPVYALAAMDSNTIKVLVYSFDVEPQLKYTTDTVITIDVSGFGKKFKVSKYELSATKANSAYLCQSRKITQEDCEKNLNLIDEINNASKLQREDVGQKKVVDGKVSLDCRISTFNAVLFVLEKKN